MKLSLKRNRTNFGKSVFLIKDQDSGFILITCLFMLVVLTALLGAYLVTTKLEILSSNASRSHSTSYYATEGGLNLRASELRNLLLARYTPSGTPPSDENACMSESNQGSGDFACISYPLGEKIAITYAVPDPHAPYSTTVPQGELFQNLLTLEYRYDVYSKTLSATNNPSSSLKTQIKNRIISVFQFAVFFNKDLELNVSNLTTFTAPIYAAKDLYLNASGNDMLTLGGQISSANKIYRGRKDSGAANRRSVQLKNEAGTYQRLGSNFRTLTELSETDLSPWGAMTYVAGTRPVIPDMAIFAANSNGFFWDRADLRIALEVAEDGTPSGVSVVNNSGAKETDSTTRANSCTGTISGSKALGYSQSFYNNREGVNISMLEVDLVALLNCIHSRSLFEGGKELDDATDGGVVIYFTVSGPSSSALPNNYGVRIRNASHISATTSGAPSVQSLSLVSDQGMYLHGNFNSTAKIPAGVFADTVHSLSTNWNLNDSLSTQRVGLRDATSTTINAAFIAGTDSTGGVEGAAGQNGTPSGGFENFIRLHEDWNSSTLTITGSFFSPGKPLHSNGIFIEGAPQFRSPIRAISFDSAFTSTSAHPPLAPAIVFTTQEFFGQE